MYFFPDKPESRVSQVDIWSLGCAVWCSQLWVSVCVCAHAHVHKSLCLSLVSSGVWVFRSVGVQGELKFVRVQDCGCPRWTQECRCPQWAQGCGCSGLWVPVLVHFSVHSFLLQFWCTVFAAWLVHSLSATVCLNNHHSLRCHGLSHPAHHRSVLSSFLCLFSMAT